MSHRNSSCFFSKKLKWLDLKADTFFLRVGKSLSLLNQFTIHQKKNQEELGELVLRMFHIQTELKDTTPPSLLIPNFKKT